MSKSGIRLALSRPLIFLGVLAAVNVAGVARAQILPVPQPTPYEVVDSRGVDLTSGGLVVDGGTITVGPSLGGLSDRVVFVANGPNGGWRHTIFAGIARDRPATPGNAPWYTVTIDGQSAVFVSNGSGGFRLIEGSGVLTLSAGVYTFTAPDGSVTTFQGNRPVLLPYQAIATPNQTVRPNGVRIDYHYTSVTVSGNNVYRLQSVTNNLGYQIHVKYRSDIYSTDYRVIERVTAINNAVESCSPTAFSCGTSGWPSLTFDGLEVTDALSRKTRIILGSGSFVSGIARPTTLVGQNDTLTWNTARKQVATFNDGAGTWSYSFGINIDPPPYTVTNTVTDPLAHTTTLLVSVIEPEEPGSGQTRSRVVTATNPLSQATGYSYDEAGRLDGVGNPEGDSVAWVYNGEGNVTDWSQVSKSRSDTRSIAVNYPDCLTSSAILCRRPTSTRDARLNSTDYTYDAAGNLLTVTSPAPEVSAVRPQTRYSWEQRYAWFKQSGSPTISQAGTQVWVPVEQSACATLAGVSIGQPVAACDGTADEVLTTTTYQTGSNLAASNLLPVATASGAGNGSLTATTTIEYDQNSDVLWVDGPLPLPAVDLTRYVYDAMRQQIGVIGPDPDAGGSRLFPATRTTYNRDGQPEIVSQGTTLGQADPDWAAFAPLQTSTRTYNAQARVSSEVTASGTSFAMRTDYSYDAAGRLLCTGQRMTYGAAASDACTAGTAGTFGPDRISRNTYDVADRLTQVQTGYGTASELTERTQAWTPNGRVDWIEDGAGNRSDYAYDGFDRLERLYFPVATVGAHTANTGDFEQYGYDASDNPVSKTTRASLLFTTAFDALNRITSIDAPSGNDVWYRYDNLNRRTSASHASGAPNCATTAVCTTWDALSRQLTETTALGVVKSDWDIAGRRTRLTWPDLVYVTYEYDLDDQMRRILRQDTTEIIRYTYDDWGRRTTAVRGNGVTTTYAYDAASRLAGLAQDLAGTASDITYTYSQNPASQIVSLSRSNAAYYDAGASGSATYTLNGRNQIASTPGVVWGWTAQGNLTGDGTRTYTYDAANRLTGTGSSTLTYDPLDRLAEMVGTTGARYLYDGDQVIAAYTPGTTTLTNRLVRGPWTDELVASYAPSMGLIALWTLQDHQSSSIAITDVSGAAPYTLAYDEYGVPRAGNAGRFMFTGQLWLPDFVAYHYKARAYRPDLGRFMQTDPVGYEQGLNLYAYVGNDPVNRADPDGEQARSVRPSQGPPPRVYVSPNGTVSVEQLTLRPSLRPGAPGTRQPGEVVRGERVGGEPTRDFGRTYCCDGRPPPRPGLGENPAAAYGRQAHQNYRDALGSSYQFDFRLPSGRRPDACDFALCIVRELKSDSPSATARGNRQAESYRRELEAVTGQSWTSFVDTYRRPIE